MALQLIGAGYGRTGTASLKVALEKLDLGPCYHMTEVLKNHSHIDHWLRAVNGEPDWDALFEKYVAAVDFPTCVFYEQLAHHYPDARVLLTVRDPQSWFESVNETIMSPILRNMVQGSPFGELNQRIIWSHFDGRVDDRQHMVQCFEQHTHQVKQAIPSDRLLVFEVKQGWQPLCEFLDCPVPDEPFPRINSREETKALLQMMAGDASGTVNEQNMASAAQSLHSD